MFNSKPPFSFQQDLNHYHFNSEQEFALRLWLTPKVTLKLWHKIIEQVKNLSDYKNNKALIENIVVATNKKSAHEITENIDKTLTQKNRIQPYIHWLKQPSTHITFPFDNDYPQLLKEIAQPPLLMLRGNKELLSRPQVAIVGSRNASRAALDFSRKMATELGNKGITITSGLAYGIDTQAHLGAINTLGATIAVLGQGIDKVYPKSNSQLYEQITQQGLLVSEFPLGTSPLPHHFPQRNRIISGLSLGTLIIEAALKSGSLITARTAMEQNREVFAVPGSINNPLSKGCHKLIKTGAKLTENSDDILEEIAPLITDNSHLQLQTTDANDIAECDEGNMNKINELDSNHLTTSENHVLKHLDYSQPRSLDEIIEITQLPLTELHNTITKLVMRGIVLEIHSGLYIRH